MSVYHPTEVLKGAFTHDEGFLDEITPADPSAGANLTVDLGTQRWIVVQSVRVELTTSATVANRFVAVEYIARGGLAVMRNAAPALIPASTTSQVFQFDNQHTASEWNPGTPIFAPLYPLPLPAGWQLKLTVDAIDTTDQLANCRIVCTRFYNRREE